MESVLIENPSLKIGKITSSIKRVFKKLLLWALIVCLGFTCSYTLVSLTPDLSWGFMKSVFPLIAETEKEVIKISNTQQNIMLKYKNANGENQNRCSAL